MMNKFYSGELLKKYNLFFAKAKYTFNHDNKKFRVIVAKENMLLISKYKINLIIDFLFYVHKHSSYIIHLNDVIGLPKEKFLQISGIESNQSNEKGKYILGIKDMINLIFEEEITVKKSSNFNPDNDQYIIN